MNLLGELKRRNVFRVALAYLVSAWVIAQVADLVLDNIKAPDWVMQAFLLFLSLGFIIALVISWAYELTPEGLKKDSDVSRDEAKVNHTGKKLDIITLGAALVVIGLFVYQQMNPRKTINPEITEAAKTKSIALTSEPENTNINAIDDATIAVLPFSDLSPNGDQEYFSDGIAEEILNVLVRVDSLKVASRTSAFGFRGQEALGIPLIAERLKVRHVLEGSVRKAGDTIRITAQLIDAQTDQHLWSHTYDRPLTTENIFTIQDEVASEIVQALRNHLGVELGDTKSVNFDTENLDAYELYLQARQLFFVRNTENIPKIIELAKRATDLDPKFAQAWAGLAASYSVAPSWGVAGDDHTKNAVAAAEKAIILDPELALPYAVLASVETSNTPIDFAKSKALSNKALLLDANNSSAQLWRGIDELSLGFFDRAEARFDACLNIDPAYTNCRSLLAQTYLYSGKTKAALEMLDKSILAGSTSQLGSFYRHLLVNGKLRAGLLMLINSNNSFNLELDVEMTYRRWTDPNFNFEQELILYLSQYEAQKKQKFDWKKKYTASNVAFQFKQYDKIFPETMMMFWWQRTDPEFIKSPHRKRLIREMGIYDYWRITEFPPQCRPVGEDDFECD